MRNGMGDWLAAEAPDVLAIQEVRAPDNLVREFFDERYKSLVTGDGEGVAA